MTAQLSRNAKLGLAKESTPGTYVVPVVSIPFLKASYEDVIAEIKDESYRNNDAMLQGMYQGPTHATWDIDVLGYNDVVGHFLRGVIGPDTVTAGVSTALSSNTSIGATSITTTASIPTGSTIRIQDSGGANTEYAVTGVPSGSGPYTLPITTPATGLTLAHTAAGSSVVSTSSHSFKQNPAVARPTYSLTVDDTTGNFQGYSYGALSDLQIKIDPKAAVSFNVKYTTFPAASQASFTPAFTAVAPALGWQWTMTNGGGSSTRGLTFDTTIKRAVDPISSSDGTQAPREIFQGPLEVDGTYKAIFDSMTDLNLYLNYTQSAAVATVTQPIAAGGTSLAITMSKSGWYKGKRDFGSAYVQADFSLSGIYNATDGGAVSATLVNYSSSAY